MSPVSYKDAERAVPNEIHYKKHTYLTFTGKRKQDQGAVIAIYQSVLKELKEDFPHLESITDKFDNAGCYLERPSASIKFKLEVFTNSLQ